MTPTMKRIGIAVVLVLAFVGAAMTGQLIYRIGRALPLIVLLDADDLIFLHHARQNVEAQSTVKPPAPSKPPEGTP